MRRLEEIIEEMQRLSTKPDEGTHIIADELLIEALRECAYLNTHHIGPVRADLIEVLLSAYNQIEKWYA